MSRLLIITLSSGEAALPKLQEQLRRQTFQNFDHKILAGLGNIQAHRQCYETIMSQAADYDYFIKIDADMTFSRDTALAEALAVAEEHKVYNHFAFEIFDFFTNRLIGSVNLFRSGVRWERSDEGVFVDPQPANAVRRDWCEAPAPFINHGEIVSDFECFSFGVHKAIKVLQRGSTRIARGKRNLHFQNMQEMRALCQSVQEPRHIMAFAGVLWALENKDYHAMQDKSALQALFARDVERHWQQWRHKARYYSRFWPWLMLLSAEMGWRTSLKLVWRHR